MSYPSGRSSCPYRRRHLKNFWPPRRFRYQWLHRLRPRTSVETPPVSTPFPSLRLQSHRHSPQGYSLLGQQTRHRIAFVESIRPNAFHQSDVSRRNYASASSSPDPSPSPSPASPRLPHTAITLLGLVGAAETAYLTYEKLFGGPVACPLGGSCNDVLNSPYAVLLGE